mmetsp:Transcript_11841/g.19290  ORF Transcript_11841/g.19290 Transcript_11841/m.19290 type:complete len:126 (+) Transcript_11841:2562-2939(+)|eukprot:CAMPEP_0203775108 /NCGR_PEP_ID=MMETSP0099_2-20121227/5834_1 /ASSEMBLY_ACC=CAM_ASM_000209 /TAXON_ID=96639 /ORGANISM=" , Strain NY0313808BC1" /LENGTH=125 /DNA_ID=CAMNT_0050673621 /DNA_START=160 /DNA_END=537 /DNA_ORIENTATION=-
MATTDGSLTSAPGAKVKDLLKASRDYEPLIPNAVVEYHLKKAGCIMSDPDLVRIVALAAQKITCDILAETRTRWFGRAKAEKRKPSQHEGDMQTKKQKMSDKDLEATLRNIGIASSQPPYYTASR